MKKKNKITFIVDEVRDDLLIAYDEGDILESGVTTTFVRCSKLEALDLMWKIHEKLGGNGTLTRD